MSRAAVVPARRQVAGLILCGGRSSRMGGGDKALAPLAGAPLLDRIIRCMKPQVDRLAINANGDPTRFADFGLPVIADTLDGLQGPLAGVLAGLEWAHPLGCAAVLTVPGDAPFLPPDLASRLGASIREAPGTIAVASSAGRRHPVAALWPSALRDDLAGFLAAGASRRVNDFLAANATIDVPFESVEIGGMATDPFFNVNTPQDLDEARRRVEGARS